MSMIAISKSYEEGGAEYGGPDVSEGEGETGRDVDMLLSTSDGRLSGWQTLGFAEALAFHATYASAKSAKNGLQLACNWDKRSR
jgi:hypothetical protein